VIKEEEMYNNHIREYHSEGKIGKYAPFCELMKINLISNQEVNLKKFTLRCNVLRTEETKGIMQYTNNQEDIENFTNQSIKGSSMIRDLRIRKQDDVLPKELIPNKVPTQNRREKVIRTIINYKNLEEEWKEKITQRKKRDNWKKK
jgi:hypothetical protein